MQSLVRHHTLRDIMNDQGLAKLGDGLVNLCYSLAKSLVLGKATGEKVRDSVLANAIREHWTYEYIGRRTDAGDAADAYEALMAYVWLTERVRYEDLVQILRQHLEIEAGMSRRLEAELATLAFIELLNKVDEHLPKE
ncbi:hypothetical protein EU545_01125 [Candidatus Thorarchaeota archaeon]|nr:MAG: hypothetical protein EU545_01125 [Candidatus Thorarchaeota archaeon]